MRRKCARRNSGRIREYDPLAVGEGNMALARAKGRADLSHSRRSYERGKGNGWRRCDPFSSSLAQLITVEYDVSQTKEESEMHTYRGPCSFAYVTRWGDHVLVLIPVIISYDGNYLVETVHLIAEIEALSSVPDGCRYRYVQKRNIYIF